MLQRNVYNSWDSYTNDYLDHLLKCSYSANQNKLKMTLKWGNRIYKR